MDKTALHDAIVREICIALDIMQGDAKTAHGTEAAQRESAEALYLRKCDDAIRRAARELRDGWT